MGLIPTEDIDEFGCGSEHLPEPFVFFLLRSYNHISVAVGMLNKLCKCLNLHTEKILIHSLG